MSPGILFCFPHRLTDCVSNAELDHVMVSKVWHLRIPHAGLSRPSFLPDCGWQLPPLVSQLWLYSLTQQSGRAWPFFPRTTEEHPERVKKSLGDAQGVSVDWGLCLHCECVQVCLALVVFLMGWQVAGVLGVEIDWVDFCVVLFNRYTTPLSLSAGLTDLRIFILKRHWIEILEF